MFRNLPDPPDRGSSPVLWGAAMAASFGAGCLFTLRHLYENIRGPLGDAGARNLIVMGVLGEFAQGVVETVTTPKDEPAKPSD